MAGGKKSGGDHYAVLGVKRDASPDAIKKAYRKLAREFHPDVAGDDSSAVNRFRQVQEAYEVLKEPTSRSRYDRRFQPRSPRMGPEGYRMPGGFHFQTAGQPSGPRMSRDRFNQKSNRMGLDDLAGGFGFGDRPPDRGRPPGAHGGEHSRTTTAEEFFRTGEAGRRADRSPGRGQDYGPGVAGSDVQLRVDVPSSVASKGGTVELRYPRLRAAEGNGELHRYHEIYDLKIPPGTKSGDTLRCHRWGHAGNGGSCGDLVCDVRVIADIPHPRPGTAPRARVDPPHTGSRRKEKGTGVEVRPLAISLSEAVLGGRVEVDLRPAIVMVTIPPLSSSGRRLRLKGMGRRGEDLFLEIRIILPKTLDDESRQLMERFAELNSYNPRGD